MKLEQIKIKLNDIKEQVSKFLEAHHTRLALMGIWTFWIMLALAVRIFLFQPFNIPSSSMEPVLLVGDYLFVSKYAYGYSRYAFPFQSGKVSGRVLASTPKRGDVVVFRLPSDDSQDYIKRVIGLAGDRVQVKRSELYINDQLVKRVFLGKHIWRETLAGGRSHLILDIVPDALGDNTARFKVPRHHIFVMGDNRDNSMDSRFMSHLGFVPMDNLIGRADIIYFSIEEGSWLNFFGRIRWSRIGRAIE